MLNRRPFRLALLEASVSKLSGDGGVMREVWTRRAAVTAVAMTVLGLAPAVSAQTAGYRLGTGDKLKVTVFGEDDASGEYEIDSTGAISVRLLGRMAVKGMTVSEVEQALYDQYRSRGFFKNPKISIELVNLRPFFILGEVEKRGHYPYINGLTVAQAVAIAGGYTYRASRSRITIQRVGAAKEEPVGEDAPVYPGDIIRVPERFF
jgi:protein involved in polysaccharide export with SLBB domain